MFTEKQHQELSKRIWIWVVILAVLVLVVVIRLRLLNVPLDRDEGGYAYAGHILLQGIPPFKGVYEMQMPGRLLLPYWKVNKVSIYTVMIGKGLFI